MAPFKRQITYSSRPNHRARVAHSMGDRQFRTYDTSALQPKRSKGPMIAFIAVIVVGAVAKLDVVWNIADTFNGLMAIPNFFALFALSGVVVKLTKDYFFPDKAKLK